MEKNIFNCFKCEVSKKDISRAIYLFDIYKTRQQQLDEYNKQMKEKYDNIESNTRLSDEEKESAQGIILCHSVKKWGKLDVDTKLFEFLKFCKGKVKEDVNIIEIFGIDKTTCNHAFVTSFYKDMIIGTKIAEIQPTGIYNRAVLIKSGFTPNLSDKDKSNLQEMLENNEFLPEKLYNTIKKEMKALHIIKDKKENILKK